MEASEEIAIALWRDGSDIRNHRIHRFWYRGLVAEMKIKLIDAIGIALVIVGIVMTVLSFFTTRGPSAEVRDVQIHEIQPGDHI